MRPPTLPPAADAPSGNDYGSILKYTPVDDEKQPNIMGILKVKPFKKGAKVLTVRIPKSEDMKITIGNLDFTPEQFNEVLVAGLHCTAGWRSEDPEGKKKNAKKELTGLQFNPIRVLGTIDKIEGDLIVIKGRPADGQQWPDVTESMLGGNQRMTNNHSNSEPKRRTIKAKIVEDMAKFTDAENEPLDLSDFEVGKTVEASVVLGRTGMLTALQSSTADPNARRKDGPISPAGPGGTRGGRKGGGVRI